MVRSPAACTSTAGRTCTLAAAPPSPRIPAAIAPGLIAASQDWLSAAYPAIMSAVIAVPVTAGP